MPPKHMMILMVLALAVSVSFWANILVLHKCMEQHPWSECVVSLLRGR